MYLSHIFYGAHKIRLIFHYSNSLFIWSFVTRKQILQLFLSFSQKIDLSIIPKVLSLFIMSQNSENPKMHSYNKGTSVSKAIDRFLEEEKNKTKGVYSTFFSKVMDAHGGSST